jgi:hypothetical protein
MAATLGFINQTLNAGERYQWMQEFFHKGGSVKGTSVEVEPLYG